MAREIMPPENALPGPAREGGVEPDPAGPCLIVFGVSPLARKLCELGSAMGYRVARGPLGASASPAEPVRSERSLAELGALAGPRWVIVASEAPTDLEPAVDALAWALERRVEHARLVAAPGRARELVRRLGERGVSDAELRRLRVVGEAAADPGSAAEAALALLAELVSEQRPAHAAAPPHEAEPTPLRASAVVLAAGLSRRMGPQNKLLLPIDGEPLIRRAVTRVLGAGFVEVVVVLGHAASDVALALAGLDVRSVLNADYASGQVSSVRAGLAGLSQPVDAVAICLGDQPLLSSADLRALLDAYAARPHGSILVPFRGERRGNPVVIDRQSAQETLEQGTHFGCRSFIDQHPERVWRWPAPSDSYVRDVDEPADYQALLTAAVP